MFAILADCAICMTFEGTQFFLQWFLKLCQFIFTEIPYIQGIASHYQWYFRLERYFRAPVPFRVGPKLTLLSGGRYFRNSSLSWERLSWLSWIILFLFEATKGVQLNKIFHEEFTRQSWPKSRNKFRLRNTWTQGWSNGNFANFLECLRTGKWEPDTNLVLSWFKSARCMESFC